MKKTIVDTGDFLYHLSLQPVKAPSGSFHFALSSQWRGAKDPDAERIRLSLLLDPDGLRQMRALIDAALEQTVAGGAA